MKYISLRQVHIATFQWIIYVGDMLLVTETFNRTWRH